MTREKQNLVEEKLHYDKLRKEEQELSEKLKKNEQRQNELTNLGLSKFFLFRIMQIALIRPFTSLIKAVFNIPPNRRELELQQLGQEYKALDERLKTVDNSIKQMNKEQSKHHSFDSISNDDLIEYRENKIAKETAINDIRIDNQNNPSLILKEFSQIKGWDEPIHKHKILDYVLEKKDFIDKFSDAYRNGDIAFEYDGKKYTSFQDDDFRTIYSDEVDIKDIEAALSYALGQEIVFDFNSMRYIGETFECTLQGEPCCNKNDITIQQQMIIKEYAEKLSKAIETIAKDKHPDLLKHHTVEEFKKEQEKFNAKKNISKDKIDNDYYQTRKEALSVLVASKCFYNNKIVPEFTNIKGKNKPNNPYKVMDYLFAKNNFINTYHPTKSSGISFKVEKDGTFSFENGSRAKNKVLDVYISLKDIESALTYALSVPVHYDFQSRTFKSALFEVDEKGNFLHSETIPAKEYKELLKFFKQYGEKAAELFRDVAAKEAPSLLYKPSDVKTETFSEAITKETATKKEEYERSKKIMEQQGKRVHTMNLNEVIPEHQQPQPQSTLTPTALVSKENNVFEKTYEIDVNGKTTTVLLHETSDYGPDDFDRPTCMVSYGVVEIDGKPYNYEEYSPYQFGKEFEPYISISSKLPPELVSAISDIYYDNYTKETSEPSQEER